MHSAGSTGRRGAVHRPRARRGAGAAARCDRARCDRLRDRDAHAARRGRRRSSAVLTCALATGLCHCQRAQRAPADRDRQALPVRGRDGGPHRAQRLGDARHRPPPETAIARQPRFEPVAGQQAEQEPRRGAGVAAVEHAGRRPERVQAAARRPRPPAPPLSGPTATPRRRSAAAVARVSPAASGARARSVRPRARRASAPGG